MNESLPRASVENVVLTQEERALYEKSKIKFPEMTESAFIELRQHALDVRNPKSRDFYSFNGILVEKIPESSEIEELRVKLD